jgi:hypothetical protein
MSISLFMPDDSFLYEKVRPRRHDPCFAAQNTVTLVMFMAHKRQPQIAARVSDPAMTHAAACEAASRRKSDGAILGGAARRKRQKAAAGRGKYGEFEVRLDAGETVRVRERQLGEHP